MLKAEDRNEEVHAVFFVLLTYYLPFFSKQHIHMSFTGRSSQTHTTLQTYTTYLLKYARQRIRDCELCLGTYRLYNIHSYL